MKQFSTPSKGAMGCLLLLIAAGLFVKFVAIPKFMRDRAEGQLTACRSNFHTIPGALSMYATDWNGQIPKTLKQLEPEYMKEVPRCPASGRPYTYVMDVKPFSKGEPPSPHYLLYCTGDSHAAAGVGANSPSYDSFEDQVKLDRPTPK